ncbi:MAG TPA: L-threonylcarbamoyladenylate synthase, partial [Bacteroidia bacterium]|nr:L-threonylcarbamoyladenylate synthase [Bacteroidia bacterium]
MPDLHSEIKNALNVLKQGGIILYPTDTVWGIGCDATNAMAVEKIYKLKNRTDQKSMILLVDNENRLDAYVEKIPETAWALIEYADKPLTIVYDKGKNLPSILLPKDGSIAIRVTRDDFCRMLAQRLRKPLVSTSANISGKPHAASFQEIDEKILSGVDYIVDWKQHEKTGQP